MRHLTALTRIGPLGGALPVLIALGLLGSTSNAGAQDAVPFSTDAPDTFGSHPCPATTTSDGYRCCRAPGSTAALNGFGPYSNGAYGGRLRCQTDPGGRHFPQAPAGAVLPQIGVAEEWTDNAGLSAGGGSLGNVGSDFITEITPSVTVQREAERYSVNLTYSPVGLIYANNSDFLPG